MVVSSDVCILGWNDNWQQTQNKGRSVYKKHRQLRFMKVVWHLTLLCPFCRAVTVYTLTFHQEWQCGYFWTGYTKGQTECKPPRQSLELKKTHSYSEPGSSSDKSPWQPLLPKQNSIPAASKAMKAWILVLVLFLLYTTYAKSLWNPFTDSNSIGCITLWPKWCLRAQSHQMRLSKTRR